MPQQKRKQKGKKDIFYYYLEKAYNVCPSYDMKIILGDINAKAGRE
ncbi:hypothetical protein L798_00188 [Zootermopsis nevadensis]|uniref:Craniofacial development protein 2 n=1 Tax=Zootermopsis nevadensis TaxID=136037 RepID=A0A067QNX1_ZOONE|nr:hypothetical protein L798_00188 [Zootermopsis nevadensis]